MSWDGFQRDALAELGITVYAVGTAPPRPVPGTDVDGAAAAAAPTGMHMRADGSTAAPPLLQALARAAACTPAQLPEPQALLDLAVSPAGKRVLWPRLRQLRARQAR